MKKIFVMDPKQTSIRTQTTTGEIQQDKNINKTSKKTETGLSKQVSKIGRQTCYHELIVPISHIIYYDQKPRTIIIQVI